MTTELNRNSRLTRNTPKLIGAISPELAYRFEKQPYHIVQPSPWPFLVSITTLSTVLVFVIWMHRYKIYCSYGFALFLLIPSLYMWFQDIILESFAHHTVQVVKCLKTGFKLFIASEAMFFFAFFWAFFHFALSPSIWVGAVWPPVGLLTINPWGFPFLNTIILLSSGVSLTLSHRSLLAHDNEWVIKSLIITILLAVNFLNCQLFEYKNAPFSINSGAYGSIFFLMTGFHGFHVMVGFVFLSVSLARSYLNHFSTVRHVGFEVGAWYWHFVDVVWILLWMCLYYWGS